MTEKEKREIAERAIRQAAMTLGYWDVFYQQSGILEYEDVEDIQNLAAKAKIVIKWGN